MKNITDLMNQGKTEKQCKKLTTQGRGDIEKGRTKQWNKTKQWRDSLKIDENLYTKLWFYQKRE